MYCFNIFVVGTIVVVVVTVSGGLVDVVATVVVDIIVVAFLRDQLITFKLSIKIFA